MRKCVSCREDANGHDHHLVPRFLYALYGLQENPDSFRVPVCEKCHRKLTAVWEKIRWGQIMSLGMDDVDTLIEEHYGMETMRVVWGFNRKTPEWLLKKIKSGAPEGERHKSRYVVMVNLHKRNFSDDAIRAAVTKFNEKCNPPESTSAVNYHVNNTLRRLKGERDIR